MLVACLLVVAVGLVLSVSLALDLQSAREHLRNALAMADVSQPSSLTRPKLEQTKGELFLAGRDLTSAEGKVGWLAGLLSPIASWPLVDRLEASDRVLNDAMQFTAAAQDMTDGLAPLVDVLSDPSASGSTLERTSVALQTGHARLAAVAPRLVTADGDLEAVVASGKAPFTSQLRPYLGEMKSAVAAVQLMVVLPDLLGANGSKRYMIAAENPADLRATGGYLGSWGIATLDSGRLLSLDYHSFVLWPGAGSGQLTSGVAADSFRPPAGWDRFEESPGQFVERDGWWAEDANWYPDFPTSAGVMEAFLQLGQAPVDGVITIDTAAIQALVQVLGPITLPAYGETVTAANVIDRIEFYEGRGDGGSAKPLTERQDKTFLATLASELLSRLQSASRDQLLKAAVALQAAADDKHVLLAMHQPDVAAMLRQQHWDGSVSNPAGDYLMLVDQNTTYTKIATHVRRTLDYSVQVQSDLTGLARVGVTYTNDLAASDPLRVGFTGDFRDYVRVYAPLGSSLASSTGFDGPLSTYTESGHTVFGGYLIVPLASTHAIALSYHLPAAVAPASRDGYQLTLQKQPGTPDLPFALTLQLPNGTSGSPARLNATVTRDQYFSVPAGGGLPVQVGTVSGPAAASSDPATAVARIPEVQAILSAGIAARRTT